MIDRDRLWPRLEQLLDCVESTLDAAEVPVCRAWVQPGDIVPPDSCEQAPDGREGQAVVGLARVFPVNPFPNQDATAQRCHPVEYAADIVVQHLRCHPTVDDHGDPPDPDDITASAAKQSRDRQLILEALLCCFVADVEDDEPGVFRLGDWIPVGPSGGCAGGRWAATIRVPPCRCPDPGGE